MKSNTRLTAMSAGRSFIAGNSEMARRVRAFDWAKSSLGPMETWPISLQTSVGVCLSSRFPMVIWWGDEFIQIYNDGIIPILGKKHPWSLAQKAEDVWPEIFDQMGPLLKGVMRTGEATWSDDFLYFIKRDQVPEESYFTYSYSPIPLETGQVGGVFCAVNETTQRVLSERRLRTLRDVTARLTNAKTPEQACESAIQALAENRTDVPFALLYVNDFRKKEARLSAVCGVEKNSKAAPALLSLNDEAALWPVAKACQKRQAVEVDLREFPAALSESWNVPCEKALILPVSSPGHELPAAAFITGVNSRRPLDSLYRAFFEDIAERIARSIAAAAALEQQQKKTKEELEKKEIALKEAQRLAQFGSWAWDKTTDQTTGSEELYKIFGFDPSEPIPLFANQRGTVYPVESWEKLHRAVQTTLETGQVYQLDLEAYRSDGKKIWITSRSEIVKDNKGNIVGLRGTVQDITERKKIEENQKRVQAALRVSEEQLKRALSSAKMGSWNLDFKSRKVHRSEGHDALWGFTPNVKCWTHEFGMSRIHPDDRAHAEEIFRNAVRDRKPFTAEFRVIWPDKSIHWLSVSGATEADPDGSLKRMSGITLDITERKNHEDELIRSNVELARFAFVASHDLKEPLRVVSNYVQLLALKFKGQIDESASTYIAFAIEAVERMYRLIDDLLSYSRVGAQTLDFKIVATKQLVDSVLDNLAAAIRESGTEIIIDRELPEIIGDPMQYLQLFQNLIGNAIKYRAKGRKPVIAVRAMKRNDEYVFSVSDNGIGIHPKNFHKIFEMFQRLHSREQYSGTGIGLAICKKIVERHNGRIWLESRLGEGSTFYFTAFAAEEHNAKAA